MFQFDGNVNGQLVRFILSPWKCDTSYVGLDWLDSVECTWVCVGTLLVSESATCIWPLPDLLLNVLSCFKFFQIHIECIWNISDFSSEQVLFIDKGMMLSSLRNWLRTKADAFRWWSLLSLVPLQPEWQRCDIQGNRHTLFKCTCSQQRC